MAEPELIEDFFGVYLLYCENPRYKGRTYIGYTRDPNRRIKQHNLGASAGGAYRTSNRGPWKMVLIVHGFPNNISALRIAHFSRRAIGYFILVLPQEREQRVQNHRAQLFEWAWQNPNKTIRLQHLNLKKAARKETVYQFRLRVLSEMLRVGPWCRLPLFIRWLETEYFEEFPVERKPPDHMKICHGPIKSRNLKKLPPPPITYIECLICSKYITNNNKLTCLNNDCELVSHLICLANLFLNAGEYVPIQGHCPFCGALLKWGDLIRKMKGCGQKEASVESEDEVESGDENDKSVDEHYKSDDGNYKSNHENDKRGIENYKSNDENDKSGVEVVELNDEKDDGDKVIDLCQKKDDDLPYWFYDDL